MRTRIIILLLGVLVAFLSLAPWVFVYGWNHGVVGSIDGAHPIDYWRAALIEGVLGALGMFSALAGLSVQVVKLVMTLRSTKIDGHVPHAVDTVALMRYAQEVAAGVESGATVTCGQFVEGGLPDVCRHCGRFQWDHVGGGPT